MKTAFLVFGIPLFVFTIVSIGMDIGPILPMYSDADLTPYLAAVSLGLDHDLAYTRTDSDRFFREQLRRPVPFQVVQKKILSSSGRYVSYFAFYQPDLYVYFLVPFVALFSFHGLLISQTLLIAAIYWIGFLYYRIRKEESANPPLNSFLYHTLVPLPVLFLLPTHHLFLYALVFGAAFAYLKRHILVSAVLLAIAASSQPLALLVGILCVSYWQSRKLEKDEIRPNALLFAIALIASCFAVWGIERLMYPAGAISEVRRVSEVHRVPLSEIWNQLPVVSTAFWDAGSGQRVIDFLFGRNTGFLVYGFPAFALVLTSLWVIRDPLVKSSLLFFAFFLIVLSFTHPSGWNIVSFANDHYVILCAIAFFLLPMIHPVSQGIAIIVPAIILAGPLLINPLGAHTSRNLYVQSFPYKYFPAEITLTGYAGILKSPPNLLSTPRGTIYFLNQSFYKEADFFWVHGASKLEILIEQPAGERHPNLEIRNGELDNEVIFRSADFKKEFTLSPSQSTNLDLNLQEFEWKRVHDRDYLHATIESKNGYVPKLFSRDNPDYRYLGCRIRSE